VRLIVPALCGRGALRSSAISCGPDVILQIAGEIVMRRHLMFFAVPSREPHPSLPSLHIEVLDPHPYFGSYPSEGIDHQAYQGPIIQLGEEGS
jgi:hypothetical protein